MQRGCSSSSQAYPYEGHAVHTGEWAKYSDLNTLWSGYGHWVKGAEGVLFTAKEGLSLPKGFTYNVINSLGEAIETTYNGYRIKLLADYNASVEPQSNHISIVVHLNGNDLAPLHIQGSYLGHTIVVALYDANGELNGVSSSVLIDGNKIINITTLDTLPPKEEETIDESEVYKGIQIYKLNMPYANYQLPSLTDNEFNTLAPADQRLVAEKLLATLFYGFEHTELEAMINSGKFMTLIKEQLTTKESNLAEVDAKINDPVLYKSCLCTMKTFSNLFHLTMGEAFINRWSAYILNQTILFSPAYELDTVSVENICNVNAKLINYADDHYSMRFTTFAHMISEDNWRRFRSPEDNGREMLEIYMLDFNDSKVPITAKALQNWYLSGNDNTLVIDTNVNREPLSLFDTTIYDGFDFYSELLIKNQIHAIIAEEDDHISIAHDGSAGDTVYPHTTWIQDNRFIGFTRRAVKMMIPNATVERNYCESTRNFDTVLHPPHTGIDIMGVNATISDNQVRLYGGTQEQYLCHMAYNALDYEVKNNTFEMVDSIRNTYMYYIKGNTRGKILDNYHKITTPQEGKIEALVFQTVWKETRINNDMIYQGKRYSGDVAYAVHYSGRESENIAMTEIYQGEYVRTIFEGDRNSSEITLKKSGWNLSDVV